MKKLLVALLVVCLGSWLWADQEIQFSNVEWEPEPMGSLQVEPSDEIMDIFTDNEFTDDDIDAKYLKMVRDFRYVPQGTIDDINEVVAEDPDDVLDKIKAQLKSHLVAGKVEYVYMLIGNRLFSATLGER